MGPQLEEPEPLEFAPLEFAVLEFELLEFAPLVTGPVALEPFEQGLQVPLGWLALESQPLEPELLKQEPLDLKLRFPLFF